MYTRPSERVQYRSRTTGAPVPAPGDKHGLPAAKSPSGRPKDNWPLIRTLFYYSPEEIAAIRDFERRAREWKAFIADDSYDNDDESEDEGAHIRAAYAAAREDLREGSEATQPLGERGGLDWSDEEEEEEVDLVGEAQARFRSWDETANKAASGEGEQDSPAEHTGTNATLQEQENSTIAAVNDSAADPSANATTQAQECPFSAIANDSDAQDAVEPSAIATPQAQKDQSGTTVDNTATRDAVDPSLNATPQVYKGPSSAAVSDSSAGDVVDPNPVSRGNEQEAHDFADGNTAVPQMPLTPRLEGIDHIRRTEKRRSQSPPEREGSSGRVKLMETIAEGEGEGDGTESEGGTPTSSEAGSEGKEMEER